MLMIINLLSLLILFAGLLLVIKPDIVLGFIARFSTTLPLYASAVVIRLFFGLLLITYAGQSRFPTAITVIGWIAVIAAVVFAWISQDRFTAMLKWILKVVTPFSRAGGVVAFLFGWFMLYAFL